MILRNHGLLVGGHDPRGVQHDLHLERACQAQIAALAGGGELVYPAGGGVRAHRPKQFHGRRTTSITRGCGKAALRLIEDEPARIKLRADAGRTALIRNADMVVAWDCRA